MVLHFSSPIIVALITGLLCSTCQPTKSIPSPATPNIIFILADDLGWADLPVYGNQFNEAPHLTQLARDGMRFTNAYAACPVCSPTRASIQSGQYPAHVGVIDFITGHWRPYEEVIVPKNRTQHLPAEIVTVGEAMKASGYATGYFGKWHLGGAEEHLPGNQGYEDWRIHRRGTFYNLKSKQAIFPEDPALDDSTRLSTALTDYSLQFIEGNKDRPFFLFLAHYDVHVQLDADQELIDKYLNKDKWEDYPSNAVYAAMIEHIDDGVGRLVAKLESLGLTDNTMIVFFSDNGGLVSRFDEIPLLAKSKLSVYEGSPLQYVASSNAPLRAEKGTVFEGGIREPMIVKWPAKVKAGSVSDALVTSVDFYPTFVELANGTPPIEQELDGESFVPVLEEKSADPERAIFWHYPVYHHDVPASAIRKGDWKLIEYLTDERVELYNLKQDIGETQDLSAQHPDKRMELLTLLSEWRVSVAAEFPVPNPDFDPDRRKEWGRHPDRK
ncbi:MAG: sulfatase [Bacteroidota bacterium]